MVSSSLDALCHVAQELDLDKKYWEGKPKLIVIKSIRKCCDVKPGSHMNRKNHKSKIIRSGIFPIRDSYDI